MGLRLYGSTGGGTATTDASQLTSGTLPSARIADGSIADAKLTSAKASLMTRTGVKTANYTAALWDLVPCDTSGGAFTVTLPAASGGKGRIALKLVTAGNTLSVALTGSDHFNSSTGATTGSLALTNQGLLLESDGVSVWTITADDIPLSQLDARYDASGAATAAQTAAIAASAQRASNLSDLASASTARTNLGLGTAAQSATTDFYPAASALYAYRTTDGTAVNNSTTLVTSAVLVVTLAANSVYEFRSNICYTATTTADLKFGWATPSGATGWYTPSGLATAATATSGTINMNQAAISATSAVGGAGTAGGNIVTAHATGIVVTTTGGTFALQYAQNTADVSDLTIRAGSFLAANKIG